MKFHWLSAAESHTGNLRRLNEDACLNKPESGLWAVADGMGGHSAGDVASGAVVEALSTITTTSSLADRIVEVNGCLQDCNLRLRQQARESRAQIIGTTVVVLIVADNRGACLWAGDSRIYRFRDGELMQLTEDHSQVQELVSQGKITSDEARDHAQNNVVTRAVGASDLLDVASVTFDVLPQDLFLLCSDGLTGELTDAEIVSHLVGNDCQRTTDALIEAVLAGQARDNVSVVVAQVFDDTPTEIVTSAATTADHTDKTIITDR